MNRFLFEKDPFLFPYSVFDEVIKAHSNRQGFPVYDVSYLDDRVVVEFALAGYTTKQLSVWTEGTKLCVSASKKENSREGGKIAARSFNKDFEAKGLDLKNIDVSFIDGILKIEVPRIEPTEPKKRLFKIKTAEDKLLK